MERAIEIQPPGLLSDLTASLPEISPSADNIAAKALEVNNDEKPIQNEQQKRGRGRPRKDGTNPAPKNDKSGSRLGGVADSGQRDRDRQTNERLATASFCVTIIEQSGSMIAGEEAAMNSIEKNGMTATFERYLEAKGISDIPPGVALSLVMLQYYGRVLTTPQAKPKVENFAMWVRTKLNRIKNARFNRRNDRKRKDNSSEKTDNSVQSEGDKDGGS